ncbi:MAG TPA: hypothetical protein DCQ83_00210 [Fibrobacteres bacterium]|jgi:hypothetical protein|nr:hypothetical protein [Fibrobacterota bacterium]
MPKQSFPALIEIRGINPFVLVNAAWAKKLQPDWRKPMPVLVRINGEPKKEPWRINMMPVGNGDFYLYLHEVVRKASGTKVGDKVRVEVAFDAEYRNGPMHPMPVWFERPLMKNKKAKKNWDALIPSRQKEILRYLSHLKSPEAQARNLEKCMAVLSGTRGRFMARDW